MERKRKLYGWSQRKLWFICQAQKNARKNDRRKRKSEKRLKHNRRFHLKTPPPEVKEHGRTFQRLRTKFPKVLDIVKNTEETLRFFSALKAKTLYDPADEVLIDPSHCQEISADAALVLTAELMRASACRSKLRMKGTSASHPAVHQLLGQIGYYKSFDGIPWSDKGTARRVFLQQQHGHQVDGAVIKSMV